MGREKAVSAAIRRTEVTRIIVAHRPETIRSADRVVVLEQGKIMKNLQCWLTTVICRLH